MPTAEPIEPRTQIAPVPEIAVDKNGNSRAMENDVRPARQFGNIDAITHSKRVKLPSKQQLRFGILLPACCSRTSSCGR
jgi:hypothetical protein